MQESPVKKSLTVRQPWAHAIIHGGKDVENRSQPTKHRGRLYIHAGKGYAPEALRFPAMSTIELDRDPTGDTKRGIDVRGMVIGTVDVIDCHHADDCWDADYLRFCSKWAMPDHHHWTLANAQPVTPFPARGMLGIWKLEQ
jgi:hypothetical protein